MNKIRVSSNVVNVKGVLELDLSNNEYSKIDFIIEDNSKLYIVDISDNIKNKEYNFILNNDSYLEVNKLYKTNNLDEIINIDLNGINSEVKYNFSTMLNTNQNYIININHNNKNTISNIINHGVVENNSTLNIEVNGIVKKGCTNSVLNQDSNIITLGDNNSNIKPNLYIDEYLVEARHGASIGKFNKDQIFYLKLKGINESLCYKLLTKGFLLNHLNIDNKDNLI